MTWSQLASRIACYLLSSPIRASFLPGNVCALYVGFVRRTWRALGAKTVACTVPGVGLMRLNPSDLIGSRLFFYGTWEPVVSEFLRNHTPVGKCVTAIDIGANIGYYTLMFSRLIGSSGTIYAIEPSPVIRNTLEENIVLNRLTNVRVVPYGISDRNEQRQYFQDKSGNLGASHFGDLSSQDGSQTGTLRLQRLVDTVPREDLARAAIIKIDVEGMEYQVLRDLFNNLVLLPQPLLILAELRFDPDGNMASLVSSFTQAGFDAYQLANRYDQGFYTTSSRPEPVLIYGPLNGQHDVAFLRT